MSPTQPKRVAIVGGGCAGVTAFWALQKSPHDVHLFEASATLGGRIKTVPFEHAGNKVTVNTVPPVFNATASPNLVSLLRYLGISTSAAELSFGATDGIGADQWTGSILGDIVRRPWLLCKPGTWRMWFDIARLRYTCLDLLVDGHQRSERHAQHETVMRHYFASEEYSNTFYAKYLTSMLSALWGINAGRIIDLLPVKAFVRCLLDHSILCPRPKRLNWQCINDGARQLVLAMARAFPSHRVHVKTRVTGISQSTKERFVLITSDGQKAHFDHLIFAISANEIQRILGATPTTEETEILQKLRTARHIMVLHSDPPFATDFDQSWPASSFIVTSWDRSNKDRPGDPSDNITPRTCLTCVMNDGQNMPIQHFGPVLITLDPFAPPHPLLVAGVWEFTDLEISTDTLQALRSLPAIQNKRGLSFCLSWTGRGFLEDAVTSGLTVAVERLGAKVPFAFEHHPDLLDATDLPQLHLTLTDHLIRTLLSLLRFYVLVIQISLILLGALRGSLKNKICLPRK
ncbi:uncharacterized protein P174DRAFT_421749 [Aspergillus novofumigatus IBT 16806]|uniref:FAD/NAD(P)-binding domain-containing protein n=1 Tax=Aspergillus novofumigatus (strain IBT 16806) TaxID=1392255 RepID=A0A2I1C4X9_ASPN1|nr:FAD/NAD(P)-binding domain-containing protein [Aspergillus novofumigatus IBT 16806]PKX92700.1 FAD/NAD(P)-binding domain-containing protein [Aspergillus novofumigatus IBT 16806]